MAPVAVLDLAETGPIADDGTSAYPVPQATIELAGEVADWSGLYGDPPLSSPSYAQLLMPVAPADPYSAPEHVVRVGRRHRDPDCRAAHRRAAGQRLEAAIGAANLTTLTGQQLATEQMGRGGGVSTLRIREPGDVDASQGYSRRFRAFLLVNRLH
jgi:hypothetical protein